MCLHAAEQKWVVSHFTSNDSQGPQDTINLSFRIPISLFWIQPKIVWLFYPDTACFVSCRWDLVTVLCPRSAIRYLSAHLSRSQFLHFSTFVKQACTIIPLRSLRRRTEFLSFHMWLGLQQQMPRFAGLLPSRQAGSNFVPRPCNQRRPSGFQSRHDSLALGSVSTSLSSHLFEIGSRYTNAQKLASHRNGFSEQPGLLHQVSFRPRITFHLDLANGVTGFCPYLVVLCVGGTFSRCRVSVTATVL